MKIKLLFISYFFLTPLIVFAQETPHAVENIVGSWEVSASPALSIPGPRSNDLQSESFAVLASVEYQMTKKTSFGIETGHAFGHTLEGDLSIDFDNDGIKEVFTVESDQAVESFQLTSFVKFGKSSDYGVDDVRWARRYLHLGLGLYHLTNPSGQYRILTGLTSTGLNLAGQTLPIRQNTINALGFNLGFGLGVRVWTHYRIGSDLRYHRLFRKPQDADYVTLTFRISRLFR